MCGERDALLLHDLVNEAASLYAFVCELHRVAVAVAIHGDDPSEREAIVVPLDSIDRLIALGAANSRPQWAITGGDLHDVSRRIEV